MAGAIPSSSDANRELTRRTAVVGEIAAILSREQVEHPLRVAVDGVTASGKTTLAHELAAAVQATGRPTIQLTMDGFHHPRRHRYRRGRLSAEGYYEDAYDFRAFADLVLTPLGPEGDRRYRSRIIDLNSDQPIDEPPLQATADAVLIVDGSFLQRPGLAELWDQRIFVNTSLGEARRRGTTRDADQLGGVAEAERVYEARYHAAARLYIAAVDPARRATLVVDNDDLAAPRLHQRSGPER